MMSSLKPDVARWTINVGLLYTSSILRRQAEGDAMALGKLWGFEADLLIVAWSEVVAVHCAL